jgi:serine phosphatase RsbU (regulator of sigma subunit)
MPFQEYPPLPGHPGIEAAAFAEPFLGEVANGDGLFCEVGRADGALMLLLVDITHHGPATVVTMDTIRAVLAERRAWDLAPAGLLQLLHEALAMQWEATTNFAAACAVRVGPPDEDVAASKAAQPSPWVRPAGSAWRPWDWVGGPPLGVPFEGILFLDAFTALPAGSSLLAFTDGVTEGGAKAGVGQFQHGPLAAHLGGLPAGASAGTVIAALESALRAHVGPAFPDDDTTAFCVRRP